MILAAEDWIWLALSVLKTAVMVGLMLTMVAYTVLAERRILAFVQNRIGPNRVGIPLTNVRLWGLGQPIADGLKFLFKEEFTPAYAHKFYFYLAPILAMAPALITVSIIPFGSELDLRPLGHWLAGYFGWSHDIVEAFRVPAVIANLDIGILFTFAIVSVGVYGIVLAGWASNSKYPFLGGIRSSAQMISYEIAMGLSVVPILLLVGSLNLSDIVKYQIEHGWLILPFWPLEPRSWIFWVPVLISFFIFLIAAFAETNRAPFDLPESEQELVGGYHTEYGAMKFGLFFLGEYAAMIGVSALMVTLFFGGWSLPFAWFNGLPYPSQVSGVEALLYNESYIPWWFVCVQAAVFLAKVGAFIFFFIMIRWILPRPRYDQLMRLGWNRLIPVALANILFTAALMVMTR